MQLVVSVPSLLHFESLFIGDPLREPCCIKAMSSDVERCPIYHWRRLAASSAARSYRSFHRGATSRTGQQGHLDAILSPHKDARDSGCCCEHHGSPRTGASTLKLRGTSQVSSKSVLDRLEDATEGSAESVQSTVIFLGQPNTSIIKYMIVTYATSLLNANITSIPYFDSFTATCWACTSDAGYGLSTV